MPIYEYSCQSCESEFELLRTRAARDETVTCPTCGGDEVERIMSSFCGRVASVPGDGHALGGSESCATCSSGSCTLCRR